MLEQVGVPPAQASFRQSIEYYDRGGELWKVSVDKLADVVCGALKFDVAAPEASLAARPHGILSCMANVFLAVRSFACFQSVSGHWCRQRLQVVCATRLCRPRCSCRGVRRRRVAPPF